MMTTSMQERDHAARQHALEQLRLGRGIVGVRLDLDAEADPLRLASLGHGSWPPRLRAENAANKRYGAQGAERGASATARGGSRIVAAMRLAPLRRPAAAARSLAGCGRVTDSEQLRLCRLIPPVLHPDGTEIREIRVGAGAARPLGPAHRLRGARAAARPAGAFRRLRLRRDHVRARPARSRGGRDRRGRAGRGAAPLSQALPGARPSARAAKRRPPEDLPQFPAAAAYALQQLVNARRARRRLRAARHRLFADLRAGRADQSGVRRDRRARRLWGDRRGRGGGRARHRRRDRRASRSPSCWRRRSRAAGACWSAAWWSSRCTRATGSASRS